MGRRRTLRARLARLPTHPPRQAPCPPLPPPVRGTVGTAATVTINYQTGPGGSVMLGSPSVRNPDPTGAIGVTQSVCVA